MLGPDINEDAYARYSEISAELHGLQGADAAFLELQDHLATQQEQLRAAQEDTRRLRAGHYSEQNRSIKGRKGMLHKLASRVLGQDSVMDQQESERDLAQFGAAQVWPTAPQIQSG